MQRSTDSILLSFDRFREEDRFEKISHPHGFSWQNNAPGPPLIRSHHGPRSNTVTVS